MQCEQKSEDWIAKHKDKLEKKNTQNEKPGMLNKEKVISVSLKRLKEHWIIEVINREEQKIIMGIAFQDTARLEGWQDHACMTQINFEFQPRMLRRCFY